MVLYGKIPTAAELEHNKLESKRTDFPEADGELAGKKYWNCTRAGVTYKIGFGDNPFGQYFSYIYSVENQVVELALRELVRPNTAVIDVGAAYGSYTLPFLVSGHPVYSFEIAEDSFHEMMGHIRLNADKIVPEHINCYNYGLYSSEITGDYYNMKNVKFRTMDGVLPDLKDVSFIKIDVEGAELEVMKGGAQLLQNNQPSMWIECHEIFHEGITEKVIPYIKELGFKGFTIKEYELVFGTKHLLVSREKT